MKKLLSILLALLLCLGMCPPAALGANETLTTTLDFTNVGGGGGRPNPCPRPRLYLGGG